MRSPLILCLWLMLALAGLWASPAAAQTWGAPVTLSASLDSANDPEVAANGAGLVFAVWTRDDGVNDILRASRFSGGVWGPELSVSAPGEDADAPDIAVDGAGVATAVWISSDGADQVVQASRFVAGVWTAPVDLSAPGDAPEDPRVIVDGLGVVTVIWEQDDGGVDSIQAARYSGGSWGAAVDLTAVDALSKELPQITADPAGIVTAVWTQFDGSNSRVLASRFGGVSWTAPVFLSLGGEDASRPHVVADGAGDVTAVWSGDDGVSTIIKAARFSGGVWTATPDLTAPGLVDQADPRVAVDAMGVVTAVWLGPLVPLGDDFIRASRYSAGVWSAPVAVSLVGQSIDTPPRLTVDGAGIVTAGWGASEGGGDVGIFASRFVAGTWGAPVRLSDVIGAANDARLAVDGAGVVTAVWTWDDGSNAVAQAARFGATPPATVPTLTEWAMILLTLTLAGSGAVLVGRRRRA